MKHIKLRKIVFVTILFVASYVAVHAQHNTYYIGHSGFGWDLIVGEMVNDLATDAGVTTYNYNFQFIGGTCVANQWANHASPQGGTDSWVELQTGNYDILVLAEQIPIQEVIYGSQWCNPNILTSVQATDNFRDMAISANANTKIYLMEFHNEIDKTSATPYENWVNLNTTMRPLWEQVVDSVNLINSSSDLYIVPVAKAFQSLVDSVVAGVYPGITDWYNLFDPNDTAVATIHPTEETYYLVACVHYATIFGQSPVGLTNQTIAAAGWPFDPPTPAQALMMQEIAWEIVKNDPYTGVSGGISDNAIKRLSKKINTFPNPFEYRITINAIGYHFRSANFKLFNSLGEQEREIRNINGTEFSLDRKDLKSGFYFFQLTDKFGLPMEGKFVVE